jgi:nucleotide-binding universal stress UspA family protein
MSSIHTIMVAVDLSKYSLPTAQYASKLAHDLAADLLFVNVINQRDIDAVQSIATANSSFPFEQYVSDRMQERRDKIDELIQACRDYPNPTRTIVRIGMPYTELLRVIDEETPDLLVMATKGRTDLVDVVMGSCARSMYRRSPIPLLSLRGDRFFK